MRWVGSEPSEPFVCQIADHRLCALLYQACLRIPMLHSIARSNLCQARRSFSTAASLSFPAPAAPSSKANISSIKRLGVVGAGQMGGGIGIVAAVQAKLNVLMVDVSAEGLARNTAFTRALLEKDVKKGKITQTDAEEAMQRITTSTNMDAVCATHRWEKSDSADACDTQMANFLTLCLLRYRFVAERSRLRSRSRY